MLQSTWVAVASSVRTRRRVISFGAKHVGDTRCPNLNGCSYIAERDVN